jgi:hypothetical protein
MGLPAKIVADLSDAGRDAAKGFEVWRVNWPIVDAFLAVATQWRQLALVDGRVLWAGLDYTAADVALRRAEIAITADQWRGLQLMEREAAAALNGR